MKKEVAKEYVFMDYRNYSGDVRIAVCCGETCVGMFGNGIVHDIVFHCKSYIFRHTWIPLRQGYKPDVESTFGVLHRFSCRNVAVL